MKIEGPNKSSDVSKKKKTDSASSGSGIFRSLLSGGASETAGASHSATSSSISSIDALLMAQATEDPAQQKSRKRMRERAESLLDKLNDLKMAILMGNVTIGHMISIADVVAIHREKITDPDLSALLDEIDLRAQIELAKIQVAEAKAK